MVYSVQMSWVGFTPAHIKIILVSTLHPGDTGSSISLEWSESCSDWKRSRALRVWMAE